MSHVFGNFADVSSRSMGSEHAVLTWRLSGPATEGGTPRKMLLSAERAVSVIVDGATGDWALDLVSTESMREDRYYIVSAHYLDGESQLVGFEEFPWRIRVPEGEREFVELVREWSSPLGVGIGTTPPEPMTHFWLDHVTGDLYRKRA